MLYLHLATAHALSESPIAVRRVNGFEPNRKGDMKMQAILNANTDSSLQAASPVINASGHENSHRHAPSISRLWIGRVVSGVPVLFLIFDGVVKLMKIAPVEEATTKMGYSPSSIVPIGTILLLCVLVHVVPRTAVLGAVLLTGYLGGAIATHLRLGDPLLSHVLFPIYVAVLLWGGLYLRDPRVRTTLAPSSNDGS